MWISRQYFEIILILGLIFNYSLGLWWSLDHSDPLISQTVICRKARKLRGPLKNLCRKAPQIISEVIRGFAGALEECGHQFEFQRWNCSLEKKIVRKTLSRDSREAAVLNAFSAAGVMHAVASACARRVLPQCECEQDNPGAEMFHSYEHGNTTSLSIHPETHRRNGERLGVREVSSNPTEHRRSKLSDCRNTTLYGYKISRKISDGRHSRHKIPSADVRTVVQHHNNEVGRKVVLANMRTTCKCHGLSGSCNLKTCSQKLPSVERVGTILFQKYLKAVQVISTNDGRRITPAEGWMHLRKDQLVYLEDSPNFCRKNIRLGSLGTEGRECKLSDGNSSSENCDLLCCGRGYSTKQVQGQEKCDCKLTLCFKVFCKLCTFVRSKTFCN